VYCRYQTFQIAALDSWLLGILLLRCCAAFFGGLLKLDLRLPSMHLILGHINADWPGFPEYSCSLLSSLPELFVSEDVVRFRTDAFLDQREIVGSLHGV